MSEKTGPVSGGPQTESKEIDSFVKTGQTLQIESGTQPIEVLCTDPKTPMLDQESTKNDFFILQDFWPIFKVFQILGLLPCKRETNEKGAIQLKPIKWWIPVLKILGLVILLNLPKLLLLGHLISSNKEVSDYFKCFWARLFSKNTARAYVTEFFWPVFLVLYSCLLWALMIKRKELCAIQETFSTSPINNTAKKATKTVRKAKIYIFLALALKLAVMTFVPLYFYLPLHELLSTGSLSVLIVILILEVMMNLFILIGIPLRGLLSARA